MGSDQLCIQILLVLVDLFGYGETNIRNVVLHGLYEHGHYVLANLVLVHLWHDGGEGV